MCKFVIPSQLLLILSITVVECWVQRGKGGSAGFDKLITEFDERDLRFNDYENRLEDSFFKYVARTDDYDRNEVPWEDGGKPVQVQMSAYLREVLCEASQQPKIHRG